MLISSPHKDRNVRSRCSFIELPACTAMGRGRLETASGSSLRRGSQMNYFDSKLQEDKASLSGPKAHK